MANTAAHTTQSASPSTEAAASRPVRRGGVGRALGLLSRLTLGGAGAALLLAPASVVVAQLGPWAETAVATGWTAADVAGAGLLGFAGLWTVVTLLRRPRWEVTPQADARTAPATGSPSATTTPSTEAAPAALKLANTPAPKRVDDVDPAAVRSTWSASAPKAQPAAGERADDASDDAPATVPFPAAADSRDEAEEPTEVAARPEWPEEWGDEGNEPSVIRFEDVPRTVEVGGRVVDLTEMDFEGGKEDRLKGLSKKERRTVRKALRDRERMLMRAA